MIAAAPQPLLRVAIACGGTGGHLFPGLAVAEELRQRGCELTLLISPKEVDQEAVRGTCGMEIGTLPAVGLSQGHRLAFLKGFLQSYRAAGRRFRTARPRAVLAMGGFTSAPPILAAKRLGVPTFLHESNSIPGRANRWLSWAVTGAFVGFPAAARGLRARRATVTGTPVRQQFQRRDPGACRVALGLDPARPVVLVAGGSQGAVAVNALVRTSLPLIAHRFPRWQWFHLAGHQEALLMQQAYAAAGIAAVVHPFFPAMELALGAATAAISRAGASSLAELAAMRVPGILIPFPSAVDNHQFHNAGALEKTGAARRLEQRDATPEGLVRLLQDLVEDPVARQRMQTALGQWHTPDAAQVIAATMLGALAASTTPAAGGQGPDPGAGVRAARTRVEAVPVP